MFRLFDLFGRSREVQRLDLALRAAGVHPAIVPDAVKFALLKQLKEAGAPDEAACREAAELLGYCLLGPTAFAEANDPFRTAAAERRMAGAVAAGTGMDARLVLLTMHAQLIHPEVVARYRLEAE